MRRDLKDEYRLCGGLYCCGGRGVVPIMAYTWRLHPTGVPFFRFRVYERVEKCVILICKRTEKG